MRVPRLEFAVAASLVVGAAVAPTSVGLGPLDLPIDPPIVEPSSSPSPEPTTEPTPPSPAAPVEESDEDVFEDSEDDAPIAPPPPVPAATPSPSLSPPPPPHPTFVDWQPPALENVKTSDATAVPWGVLVVTSVGIVALIGLAVVQRVVLAPRRRRLRTGAETGNANARQATKTGRAFDGRS